MSMNFDKFTERSRGYIQSAQSAAAQSNHQQLTPEHLFKILVEDQESLATKLVEACGGNVVEQVIPLLLRIRLPVNRLNWGAA